MISPWLTWVLTVAGFLGLSIGAYLLGYHRGYLAGRSNYIGGLPGDAWKPPSEAEFFAELLDRERINQPPSKYRREP